jgi:hypothetical protein
MGNHQIPSVVEDLEHVALQMLAGTFCGEQVARPRVVPHACEGVADDATELARHQHLHRPRFASVASRA